MRFNRYLMETWYADGKMRYRAMVQYRIEPTVHPVNDRSAFEEMVRLASIGYLAERAELRRKAAAKKKSLTGKASGPITSTRSPTPRTCGVGEQAKSTVLDSER